MTITDWLTIDQVSTEIQVPVSTIYQWRHRGVGPRAHKFGRHLRYSRADLTVWQEAQADGHLSI